MSSFNLKMIITGLIYVFPGKCFEYLSGIGPMQNPVKRKSTQGMNTVYGRVENKIVAKRTGLQKVI